MDERVKLIARFLEGEKIAALAREFGISRKTAYKIIERYHDTGLEGLTDLGCAEDHGASGRGIRTSTGRRSRPFMRYSTAMVW